MHINDNTVGSLSQEQRSILVGSLLGDGTLRRSAGRNYPLFEVNHSIHQRFYVDWKYMHLKEFVGTEPKSRKGNGKRIAYRFTTRSLPIFSDLYELFYREGEKRIPNNLTLNALALAVWFMDDGSKSRSACYLNTQQFSLDDQMRLVKILKEQFAIEGKLNKDKQYFRIRITTASSPLLKEIIRPYILSEFFYKLGHDPVTT